ncbi:hypothetical protein [Halostagnicola kamekurae]|uniref:Uncharacterized protein n=1 Tax=Halostagnicola kamekurae TaxID=619731 RepID=A0A1I6UXC4_9EURY|nr:hypothetical protein [Halostagnicola kamekurae]SFT06131.1 hypothetical protein SAMN04488556_4152 [Halostagnicola kamekurae]
MKKGSAGDDVLGLGGDEDEIETDDVEEPELQEPAPDFEDEPTNPDLDSADDLVGEPAHAGASDSGVPWVYTRDNVQQDRDMVQFYLRRFVQEAEGDFVDAVGEQLGTDVSKTDVREAAYVAAMRDPEIVAKELERWGFEGE